MDPDVTDVTEPVQDEPVAAPVPWYRRPAAIVGGIAAAVLLALVGGLIWAFSGDKPEPGTALKPIAPSAPTSEPVEPPSSDQAGGLDLIGDLGGDLSGSSLLDGTGDMSSSSADTSLFAVPGGSAPAGGLPAFQLPPAAAFPPPPAFQAPPPQDWAALLQPWIDAQQEAIAAGLGGAIAGPVVGAAWGTANTAAIVLSDLILFAAANPNGGAVLNQLQTVLPAVTVPAAASSLGAPDFSGLTAAFAAAAANPPIGVPALPPPPPGLPTPEQVLAGLAALPAPGLPPPPPIGLPTPEQAAAGLFALPAIGLPALPPPPPIGLPQLPPPPPIGLPQLPPPPPIGLPSFGFPSFGLPSITRLLGLPF
jgi:hypothetical protein